jgi:hypothetical protein
VCIEDTGFKLLTIFGKYDYGIFLRCQGIALPSKCPFVIFRFDVHVTPMVFIYSRLFHWILFDFFGICKDQLATVVFFQNWFLNSCVLLREVQFGDNWSSTSTT